MLVETSVPLVHETMDTVSEESLGLRAESFFNGFSDLIVVAPGFVASHNPGQKVVSLCAVTQ